MLKKKESYPFRLFRGEDFQKKIKKNTVWHENIELHTCLKMRQNY